MSTSELESTCPYCGRENTLATGINVDDQPDEGSVNLCWRCLEPSLFNADLTLRKPTDEERGEIMSDPDVKRALYVMRESTRPKEAKTMYDRISDARPE